MKYPDLSRFVYCLFVTKHSVLKTTPLKLTRAYKIAAFTEQKMVIILKHSK